MKTPGRYYFRTEIGESIVETNLEVAIAKGEARRSRIVLAAWICPDCSQLHPVMPNEAVRILEAFPHLDPKHQKEDQ